MALNNNATRLSSHKMCWNPIKNKFNINDRQQKLISRTKISIQSEVKGSAAQGDLKQKKLMSQQKNRITRHHKKSKLRLNEIRVPFCKCSNFFSQIRKFSSKHRRSENNIKINQSWVVNNLLCYYCWYEFYASSWIQHFMFGYGCARLP